MLHMVYYCINIKNIYLYVVFSNYSFYFNMILVLFNMFLFINFKFVLNKIFFIY